MKPNPRGVGWETQALGYLSQQGLGLIRKNFHCRLGEVDLIMADGQSTVFIEVRYRQHEYAGGALGSITRDKQLRIARAAGIFLKRHSKLASGPCRFDVVAISGKPGKTNIRWVKHAFEA